ncbi:hypothetical protein [Duffyella gerundensis]|uniref:hypothetical protein n=1 Tax=Duffyella TaxID=3026546 RepID=UPI003F6DAF58
MNIACLGWGSLIWKTEALPVEGSWLTDGPQVPIEFSRVSDGGELSTAICLNGATVPVLWARLATDSLPAACEALRQREQIPAERTDGVGRLVVGESATGPLSQWARQNQLDAVIWTALPPRFALLEGRIPSVVEAIAWLAGLRGEQQQHARDYIEQVPAQIDTPYRRAIKQQLGWG